MRIHAFRDEGFFLAGQPVAYGAVFAIEARSCGEVRLVRLQGNGFRHLAANDRVESLVGQHLFERHGSSGGGGWSLPSREIFITAEHENGRTQNHSNY